jgi:hypothetical protein
VVRNYEKYQVEAHTVEPSSNAGSPDASQFSDFDLPFMGKRTAPVTLETGIGEQSAEVRSVTVHGEELPGKCYKNSPGKLQLNIYGKRYAECFRAFYRPRPIDQGRLAQVEKAAEKEIVALRVEVKSRGWTQFDLELAGRRMSQERFPFLEKTLESVSKTVGFSLFTTLGLLEFRHRCPNVYALAQYSAEESGADLAGVLTMIAMETGFNPRRGSESKAIAESCGSLGLGDAGCATRVASTKAGSEGFNQWYKSITSPHPFGAAFCGVTGVCDTSPDAREVRIHPFFQEAWRVVGRGRTAAPFSLTADLLAGAAKYVEGDRTIHLDDSTRNGRILRRVYHMRSRGLTKTTQAYFQHPGKRPGGYAGHVYSSSQKFAKWMPAIAAGVTYIAHAFPGPNFVVESDSMGNVASRP